MKACRTCGYVKDCDFCPKCGEVMRKIAYRSEDEIIVECIQNRKSEHFDNISGFGFHVCCSDGCCVVSKHRTTSGKTVYHCGCCGLRIVID